MKGEMENLDREINEAFQKDGKEAVRKEKEIEGGEKRFGDIQAALRALDRFGGDGLADGMPLGDAVGFLEVKLEETFPGDDLGISREELKRARDFLESIIGEEYPAQMELGSLEKKLKEEGKEILG
jgi:hypothetical protein